MHPISIGKSIEHMKFFQMTNWDKHMTKAEKKVLKDLKGKQHKNSIFNNDIFELL